MHLPYDPRTDLEIDCVIMAAPSTIWALLDGTGAAETMVLPHAC